MPIPNGARRVFRLPSTGERLARELDDEVRFHLEQRIADLVAAGASPEAAREEALRRFGDSAELRDYCIDLETSTIRRMRMNDWLESLRQDLSFAARQMRRTPAFAGIVVLTLALGLGATTAIFTVVESVLLRALPYPASDRIVEIAEVNARGNHTHFSDPNFEDIATQSRSFSAIAEESARDLVSVSGTPEPVRAHFAVVSKGFFDVLQARPILGRLFSSDEMQRGAAPTILVSHDFWTKNLDASPRALGRQLKIGRASFTIIGVMPPWLDYPEGSELWAPRELEERYPARTAHNWVVIARLAPNVSAQQAQSDVSAIAKRLKTQLGDETNMVDASVTPLRERIVGSSRPLLLTLLAASAVLLLIACANVANLLIARMSARGGEVAVRLALGAGRGRLTQQFLLEALVLSVIAALLGVGFAAGGIRVLVALRPTQLPRLEDVRIDWTVLAFAAGASLVVAAALGASAAWRGIRTTLRDQLSQSQRTLSGSTHTVRRSLVAAQMALTLVLLVSASLLMRSFGKLLAVDPGFRTDSSIVLNIVSELGSATERVQFYDALVARLRAVPGVTDVGVVNAMPLVPGGFGDGLFVVMSRLDEPFEVKDLMQRARDPERSGSAEFRVAGPGYFSAMHIPVLQGRAFLDSDAPGAPHVAVVSASLAKERWAHGNPIGKIIQFGNMDGDLTPFTVVGVVGDIREDNLATPPSPTFYASYRQRPARTSEANVVIAHHGAAAPIIASAREIVRSLRPDVPPRLRRMEDIVTTSVADRRFVLLLAAVFGGAALVLATLGVYSVISYLVTQQSREIGIRVALGARRGDVTRLVLRQGVGLAAWGVVIGIAAAIAATRLLRGLLFDVSATDPTSFAAVLALLVVVALIASYVPARRAGRVSPMEVLRNS